MWNYRTKGTKNKIKNKFIQIINFKQLIKRYLKMFKHYTM